MANDRKPTVAKFAAALTLAWLAGAAIAPTVASAQENGGEKVTTVTANYGGWTVNCQTRGGNPAPVCTATYRIINKQTNQNILVWLVGRTQAGEPQTEFVTPTNILIRPGVKVALDEAEPVTAEYVSCGGRGCKASLDLTAELADRLRAAKKATLSFTELDGKQLNFTMDVTGVEKALADLKM